MRKAGLVTIISLTCYLALMLGITQWQSDGLGFDTDPMSLIRPLAIYLSFYAVMCIGILFSAAFRLIKAGPDRISISYRVNRSFRAVTKLRFGFVSFPDRICGHRFAI